MQNAKDLRESWNQSTSQVHTTMKTKLPFFPKKSQVTHPRGASTFSSTITTLKPTSSQASSEEGSTKQEQQSTPAESQQKSDDKWLMVDDDKNDLMKSINMSETKLAEINSANKDTPSE